MEVKCCLPLYQRLTHGCFLPFWLHRTYYIYLYAVGDVRGIDSFWFIGDEFCDRGFTSYYKQVKNPSENGWYVHENYDMFESSTTKYSSLVRNILAHFKSLLCLALRKFKTLPKAIIFIPDDDIIKQAPIPLADAKDGEYHLIARYILEETRRLIISYKEHLPKKCKRDHFPHFIWSCLQCINTFTTINTDPCFQKPLK